MLVKYAFGQQVAVFIRALQELVIRSIFQPEVVAIWNLVGIIANTISLFQISLVAASNRLLAQLVGAKSKESTLVATRGNSIYLEAIQQTVLTILLLLIAPLIWPTPTDIGGLLYLAAALVMLGNAFAAMFLGLLESNGSFARLGLLLPINAIIQAVVVYGFSVKFGILGLLFGFAVGLVLNILVFAIALSIAKIRWITKFSMKISKDLTKTAVSFRVSDIPTSALFLLDVFLASLWLRPLDLGIFMTGKIMANFSSQAVLAASRINLIKLGNLIGGRASVTNVSKNLSQQFWLVYLVLLPLVVALIEPVFRWSIPKFLPNYTSSIAILPILMLATLCSGRSLFIRNLWIHREQWRLIVISGTLGLFAALLIMWFSKAILPNYDIFTFTIFVLISQIPYAIGLIFAVSLCHCKMGHLVFRVTAFSASFLSIMTCFWFSGAFSSIPILSVVGVMANMGIGFLAVLPAMFLGWIMLLKLQSQE